MTTRNAYWKQIGKVPPYESTEKDTRMSGREMEFEYVVPTKLVRLRPTSFEDMDLIAHWFEQGSCKESFQEKTVLDGHVVLHYQEYMRQPDWLYQCMTIEDEGRVVGYLDYRYRNHLGELLGLYLDPRLRGQYIGLHLLRWVIADLRQHGCYEGQVEIHAKKSATLGRFRAAGFQHDEAHDRIEGDQRLLTLCRPISPFLYLRPPEPAYALLQGENIYLHHVALAETLTEAIQKLSGVEAILGLGSLARGFGDQWSDLDLAVLGHSPGLTHLWRGERNLAGVDVDLFVVDLDVAPPSTWDDSRLQAFEESVILFARDPSIIYQLHQAVHLSEGEQTLKIQETVLKLGWIGFQPRTWYNQHKYGYSWSVPYDLWIRRGFAASAHTAVDTALDSTLRLLFLTNGQRVPDVKWRRYLAPHLPWLPPRFSSLLEQIENGKRDEEGFRARAAAVLSMVEEIVHALERAGKICGDLYQSYLHTSHDY